MRAVGWHYLQVLRDKAERRGQHGELTVGDVVPLEETGREKVIGPFVLLADSSSQEAAALPKPSCLIPQALRQQPHRCRIGQQTTRVCVGHVSRYQEWR